MSVAGLGVLTVGLAGGPGGVDRVRRLAGLALDAVAAGAARRGGPIPAIDPAALSAGVVAVLGDLLPPQGTGEEEALATLAALLAAGSADPSDPSCAAHLHCPPLAVATAADLVAAVLNPSLDSWDQGPAATDLEDAVVAALARLVGYGPTAGGVMTTGGTESNLMGLLLARDAAVRRVAGTDASAAGLPGDVALRVYCSQAAHFSVRRAAAVLGMGEDSVTAVDVDAGDRLDPSALESAVARDAARGVVPAAVVATAGTTDVGAVDPLPAVAEVASRHGACFHVDASYGGGALFSPRLAPLLDGVGSADSVALDLHKFGWQPVPAGVFLTRDAAAFAPLARRVAYLNPADDEACGYRSLLGRSLRTTRRADALKVAVTLRALGRRGVGALVERCNGLAAHAAGVVRGHPRLELLAEPVLATVVFRYAGGDAVNAALRRRLLREGTAVVGRTEARGQVWLKLTLLNPHATEADVAGVLAAVVAAGQAEEGRPPDRRASADRRCPAVAGPEPDPFADPDPATVADAAAAEAVLRCWFRETGAPVPPRGEARVDLPTTGAALLVPVRYRSPSGWHRLGPARLGGGAGADAATVAALVVREVTARGGLPPRAGADAVARVLDSARRVAAHVAARRDAPDDPPGTTPFLAAEQALVFGHPFHPAPKSREGAADADVAALSPELRGSFRLHWFAADPRVVASDAGPGADPLATVRALYGDSPLPHGTVPVPAHPWQARDVLTRPGIAALLHAGLLHDLGPSGPAWHPTSSLRTVYRPDAPVMLKLSLGLRITNSRRNNLRSELALGVAVHRLLRAGVGDLLTRHHPAFHVVADPAWVAVEPAVDGPEGGLETVVRANPFGPGVRAACVAGLVAVRPGRGSQIAGLVRGIADRTGRPPGDVTCEWLARYLGVVAAPVLWLYATTGLALEAHLQNTLVTLDAAGWPAAGWYRDNQGYYAAASKIGRLDAFLPGFGDGLPVVFDDRLVDERLTYYLAVNNVLGVVGACGAEGLADEEELLGVVRRFLQRTAAELAPAPVIVAALLDAPTLPCKANLLTCVDGRDELEGSVERQSLYVAIPNPVAAAGS